MIPGKFLEENQWKFFASKQFQRKTTKINSHGEIFSYGTDSWAFLCIQVFFPLPLMLVKGKKISPKENPGGIVQEIFLAPNYLKRKITGIQKSQFPWGTFFLWH
jgi:hypothetical protein